MRSLSTEKQTSVQPKKSYNSREAVDGVHRTFEDGEVEYAACDVLRRESSFDSQVGDPEAEQKDKA